MADLVIHPKDHTTDFLIGGYYHQTDLSVLNKHCSKSQLRELITTHDRIYMMGHGTPNGLLDDQLGTWIDSTFVYALKQKDHNVYIWCHADQFVRKYDLRGFATGMFISEYTEALDHSVRASNKHIDDSNHLFARAIKEALLFPTREFHAKIMEVYVDDENPAVQFNRQNFFIFD